MSDLSIHEETTENSAAAAPQRQFPIWLAWTLAGVLILGGLNPALSQAQTVLAQSLKMAQQVANTLQLFFWAVISVTLGFVTCRILGKRISDPQMWLALISGAWLLVGLHSSYPFFYSIVQNPSQYPEQGAYRQIIFVFNNLVGMGTFAFAGWLVLRLNYRRAAYWILWSVVGAGIAYGVYYLTMTVLNKPGTPAGNFISSEPGSLLLNGIYYLVSFLISGIGLQRLLQRPRESVQVDRWKWKTFLALWVFAQVVGVAANDIFTGNGIQATLLRTFNYPEWVDAGVGGLIQGLILGLAGWLALNDYLPKAGWWMLAVAVGETLAQVITPILYAQIHLSLANVFWYSLGIRLLGVLILAILQAAALGLMKVRRVWYWIPIAIGIELISYLFTFYVNQKVGVLIWAGLTGLGLVFMARGGLGNLWIARPVGAEKSGVEEDSESLEDDGQVINDRLRLALESRPRVMIADDHLRIFPNKQVDPDLVEWLITERGCAAVVALGEPPLEGSPLPDDAPLILSEEDFDSVDSEPGTEEGREKLRIGLDENAVRKLGEFIQQNPDAQLYLALDGEMVILHPAEYTNSELVWDNLDPEDTFLYTSILAEPALTTEYQPTLEEEGV